MRFRYWTRSGLGGIGLALSLALALGADQAIRHSEAVASSSPAAVSAELPPVDDGETKPPAEGGKRLQGTGAAPELDGSPVAC